MSPTISERKTSRENTAPSPANPTWIKASHDSKKLRPLNFKCRILWRNECAAPPRPHCRACRCFMAGNSATAAICTVSGMTALGIKCNKPDWKSRGERKQKSTSPSGRPFRGKKGGVGHCPLFCPKQWEVNATRIHTNRWGKSCCLFSQDWLRRVYSLIRGLARPRSLSRSRFSLSFGLGFVSWASGNPLQRESELLFMSPTLKRVLYSSRQEKAKGERGVRMSYWKRQQE